MESSLSELPGSLAIITERMRQRPDSPALYWQRREFSYGELWAMIAEWESRLTGLGVAAGSVCAFYGDYSPQICALVFALMRRSAILVPFTPAVQKEMPELMAIAGAEFLFSFAPDDTWTCERRQFHPNELVASFAAAGRPGLIVFTSGSTGKPKGILHDCERVLHKFVAERSGWRTTLFLMLDHFGGFNTLISTFAYGGTAICLPDRNPDTVCRTIEESRATLLPTTPTFINIMLASNTSAQYDLSSIRLITYGTEVMPEATLERVRRAFPNAGIKQTYGLSELGVLRSKSETDASLWVKIGGIGFETRIVDNVLWIRSEANMIGYLNAENPFDKDGWMCTGDCVEVKGDFLRILGRNSEMINVGGQKVFPAEIEDVLMQAGNIRDARVFGVRHPLMGHVAHAEVVLDTPEEAPALTERLRGFCMERLTKFKIPLRFSVVDEEKNCSARFKKIRKQDVEL
jgi:acyl-CoA synthetase (AMP-forming)/AMP-acid ligase II